MLVLTRKIGEQLIIADNIRITVVSIGPGRVKIGIEAPNNVSIDREEIYTKKQNEKEVGPQLPSGDLAEPTVVMHNRIADKLPDERPVRQRLPQKPR